MTMNLNTTKNENNQTVYTPEFGTDLKVAAWNAILLARKEKQEVILDYNMIKINVKNNTTVKHILNSFFALSASAGFPQLNTPQKLR